MSNGPERTADRKNRSNPAVDGRVPENDEAPRGISEAAVRGAAKGKPEADADPQPDARVTPQRAEDEDNGAP